MSSLMKEDVELLARRSPSHHAPEKERPPTRVLVLSYVMLAVCNILFAAVGPTFLILMKKANVGHMTAAAWRNQIMLAMCLPISAWEGYRAGPSERLKWWIPRQPDVRCPNYWVALCVCGAAMGWCTNLMFWLTALQYTTTVRASLVVNTHPFVLALFYCVLGKKLGKWTIVGIILCSGGLVLSEMPAILGESEDGKPGEERLLGDFICLFAACCDAVYYGLSGRARQSVPVYTFTFLTTVICALGLTIASVVEMESWAGIAGWVLLDAESLFYFLLFGFLVGVVGLAASNYSLGNLDPLIVSSASLTGPAITGVISYFSIGEDPPGLYTIFGGLIVLTGLGIMSLTEKKEAVVVGGESAYVSLTVER